MLLYVLLANPSMGELAHADNGNDDGSLHMKNDLLHGKIVQMTKEANAQKTLQIAQNETIAQLHASIEQQAKEVRIGLMGKY